MKMATLIIFAVCIGVALAFNLPAQEWNHAGEDIYGLIAPSSTLYGRKLILTGGWDGYSNKTERWDYDLFDEDWTLTPTAEELSEFSRSHSSSVILNDFLFVFGGSNQTGNAEIQSLSQELAGHYIIQGSSGPARRSGQTTTLYNEKIYLFGGWDIKEGKFRNDFWVAEVINGSLHWELLQVEGPVPARAGHSSILYQDSLYIFGGQGETGFRNDIWRYDFRTNLWLRCWTFDSLVPDGRSGHAGFYFADEGMYVWGGFNDDGFLNDMWRFDLQEESWEIIFQGEKGLASVDIPSPRAYFAYTVIDSKFVILGGQISLGGISQEFWSPWTHYIPIFHPDDFSGDSWSFNLVERVWNFNGCLPPWANATQPRQCRSSHAPKCDNDCNGNGVCVRDGLCICRGTWSGAQCDFNRCVKYPYKGYDVELMDRVLITESVLELGKRLVVLRNKLLQTQEKLPHYDDLLSCLKWHPTLSQLMREDVTQEGYHFYQDGLNTIVHPVYNEFNEVLTLTSS